jgi:hypothetical protein
MADEDNLVRYVSEKDVRIVLERVPGHLRERLRDVFHTYRSGGVRYLGFVRRRGRRDINLCSVLPPRVSLGRFIVRGQSASEFGAPSRGQWPPWAVRRFLLYDTLLHELGHLQLVRPRASRWDRRYASETLAQQFADDLRRQLWAAPFEDPDPVHSPPKSDERAMLPVWSELDKSKRYRLVRLVLKGPYRYFPQCDWLGQLTATQRSFLRRALCRR